MCVKFLVMRPCEETVQPWLVTQVSCERERLPGPAAAVLTADQTAAQSRGKYFGSSSRWQTKNGGLHHHSDTVAVTVNPTSPLMCVCAAANKHCSLFFLKCCWADLHMLLMPNDFVHFLTHEKGAKPGFAKIFRGGAICCNKSLLHAMYKVSRFPLQSLAVHVKSLLSETHNQFYFCSLPLTQKVSYF